MTNLRRRLGRGLAQLPRRILAAAGWPTASGVGYQTPGGLDEIEAERRRQREVWRRGVDEDNRPSST